MDVDDEDLRGNIQAHNDSDGMYITPQHNFISNPLTDIVIKPGQTGDNSNDDQRRELSETEDGGSSDGVVDLKLVKHAMNKSEVL